MAAMTFNCLLESYPPPISGRASAFFSIMALELDSLLENCSLDTTGSGTHKSPSLSFLVYSRSLLIPVPVFCGPPSSHFSILLLTAQYFYSSNQLVAGHHLEISRRALEHYLAKFCKPPPPTRVQVFSLTLATHALDIGLWV
jgi:hypothetical protein